jgi:hypothetical protein
MIHFSVDNTKVITTKRRIKVNKAKMMGMLLFEDFKYGLGVFKICSTYFSQESV